MPYATDSDLTTRIPSALLVDSGLRAVSLLDARKLCDETLGEEADTLLQWHVYMTMHLLACHPDSGVFAESGPVTAAAAGEISASFGTKGTITDLDSTVWGRMAQRFAPLHMGVTG